MILRPMSLFTRMLLVMFGSIAAAYLISGLLIYRDREALASRGAVFEWSGRMAGMVRLIETIDAKDRRAVLGKLGAPQGAEDKAPSPSDKPADRAFNAEFASNFQERLNLSLGPMHTVSITEPRDEVTPDIVLTNYGAAPRFGQQVHRFDVRVTLPDGDSLLARLLVTPRVRPTYAPDWYAHIAILICILAAGALLIARAVSQPLARLVKAADSLGQGLKHPPLPETGPRELRRAAHAFNTMQDRLRRYLDGRTRILAAMSHDLKTPITRLRLRAEGVSDPQKQAKFIKDLDEMEAMVQSALDMLQGLDSDESIQRVDLNALVATLSEDFGELGLPVEVQGRSREPLAVRPQALRRALSNLLQNAQNYASKAWLSVEDRTSEVIFHVRDNGPGLPEDQLERVFEPFYRLESSRNRATGGTGLGLSIARDIAQGHGGELSLANHPGGGLMATLRLPRNG